MAVRALSHRSDTARRWPRSRTGRSGRATGLPVAPSGRRSGRPRRARAAGDRDQVAEDRARRRRPARARSVEPDPPDRHRVDLDPVLHAGRPAECGLEWQRGRQDGRLDLSVAVVAVVVCVAGLGGRGRDQADDPAGSPRVLLVGEADGGDARTRRAVRTVRSSGDGRRVEPRVEREPGQDHELVDRVVPLHVTRRIGLRVAQPLRLGQRGLELERVGRIGHRGQDEVGRAVHDAADALDAVRREVGRRAAQGRGSRHRPLPRSAAPPPVRRATASSSGAVVGDDVLVGGDDALAHRQGRGDQRVGRLVAAHQLDDDVDLGVGHQVGRRVRDHRGRNAGRDRAFDVADRDGAEHEGPAVAGAELGGSLEQGVRRPRARPSPRRGPRRAAGCRS